MQALLAKIGKSWDFSENILEIETPGFPGPLVFIRHSVAVLFSKEQGQQRIYLIDPVNRFMLSQLTVWTTYLKDGHNNKMKDRIMDDKNYGKYMITE